jgi:IS30 family transposase
LSLRPQKASQLPEATTLLNRDEEDTMSYRQLTLDERYQIQALQKMKWRPAAISRELGRHPSTLSRELARNCEAEKPYDARRAARWSRRRRVVKGTNSRKIQGALQDLVEQKLRLSWSPEQISGRLRAEGGPSVTHETIYQHVLRDTKACGFLRYCLRFAGYKHHRFKKSKCAERTRLRKNWLDQRPRGANDRSELGHWERDCVLGTRGSSALLTIVDRRSRLTLVSRVKRVNTDEVAEATLEALRPHRAVTKTITNDNGVEFQRDQTLQEQLGIPIYFTDPSSPWQRGSVENANGLVRQYVRKGTDMDTLPDWAPRAIEETLNHRPRKILNFRTPYEVFFGQKVRLTDGELMRFGLEFSADR